MTDPIGTCPTPYGVSVPVYDAKDPADPEAVFFDFEGSMTFAGVYGKEDRARCWSEFKRLSDKGSVSFDIFINNGGRKIPRIALPVPKSFIYAEIPDSLEPGCTTDDGISIRGVVDKWITAVADQHRWCERAEVLLNLANGQASALEMVPPPLAGLAISNIVTAVLENMGESELDCIEAAALHLLTAHEDWQEAGRQWLLPIRKTWFADWIEARPAYRRLATLIAAAYPDLPTWANEVTR